MVRSAATILPIYNRDPNRFKLNERNIKKYINGIYNGTITERDLSLDVYNAITDYLKAGLYDGYGMTLTEAEGADLRLLTELRENVYMFGAAKNYQMTKEISSLLVDEETGEVRTAKEFNDIARETYDNWNDNWGATEYNTAVGQAEAASKWNEIEKDAEALPNLRYSAILDANTSDICAPLDGLVAPVDDPIWLTISPLNHWNCRCLLLQEGPDVRLTPDGEKNDIVGGVLEEMQDVFKSNPGKTGEIFDKDHPYFDVPEKDKAYAKRNFDLPIPDKD
jgi:SPP1 gp7 family putative phage head morphogenesis protein